MESFKINRKQLLVGILCLLLGTMEYLVSRPIGSTYFLNKFKSIQSILHHFPNLYGKLGMFAPEFFHPLAMSLMSMAFFSSRKSKIIVCLAWLGVDSIFELSQRYAIHLIKYLPKWFETVPILENLDNYLFNGRFDIYDLVAIGLGSSTAFFIGEPLSKKGGIDERGYSEPKSF